MKTRPSEYKPSYIKKIDIYLKGCKDKWDKWQKTFGKVDTYERVKLVKLPSIEGFADFLNVSRKTIYNWQKEHEDFAEACDKILSQQKQILIANGLAGTYDSTITKVMLSHNHGMREGIDATTNGKEIKPFSDGQLNRIAERILGRSGSSSDISSKK